MIAGIGTDIAAVARLGKLYERHGERALEKILAPAERDAFTRTADPARFLAKRFAAKEAFGKALGIDRATVGQVVGRRFVVDGKLAGGDFAGESAREGVGAGEAGIMFCKIGEAIKAGHDENSCSPLRKLDKHRSGH